MSGSNYSKSICIRPDGSAAVDIDTDNKNFPCDVDIVFRISEGNGSFCVTLDSGIARRFAVALLQAADAAEMTKEATT